LIEAGVIAINGQVVTELGSKVLPGDEVRFHDRVLRTERMVYVLLNKPKDYITTTDDPDDRKTVMNLVHDACKERIFPVGRLDRNTTGLLLLTNDNMHHLTTKKSWGWSCTLARTGLFVASSKSLVMMLRNWIEPFLQDSPKKTCLADDGGF